MGFREIIAARLEGLGVSPLVAARRAGLPRDAIRSVLRGHPPSVDRAAAICSALGLEFYAGPHRQEVPGDDAAPVPFYGRVAAGGGDHPADGSLLLLPDERGEPVLPADGLTPRQVACYGGMLALQVTGESMRPAYQDGDIVYVYADDPLRARPDLLIGQDCAVTVDGPAGDAAYLKRLRRPDSGEPGLWNLESLNPFFPTMENVSLTSALPVRFIRRGLPTG